MDKLDHFQETTSEEEEEEVIKSTSTIKTRRSEKAESKKDKSGTKPENVISPLTINDFVYYYQSKIEERK